MKVPRSHGDCPSWTPIRLAPVAAALSALALSASLTGCGEIDYYMHLARGQCRIAFASRPLEEVLVDGATSQQVRATLELVTDIRRFARERAGLSGTASNYTRYFDTGGGPVSWNVSACPPDRFVPYRWWFPVVGDLPYKGFFTLPRATAERDRLVTDGYDAVLSSVSAYSTLGYFSDPILSTMVADPEDRLADLILHELTHVTVYVENETDYNESVATFVGRAGSMAFLVERYGSESEPVRLAFQRRDEETRFSAFLGEVIAALDSLYALQLPRAQVLARRADLFARAKEAYRERRPDLGDGRYDGFLEWEVNNARLLSYRRYHKDLEGFEAVLRRCRGDLAAAVGRFRDCAKVADPWSCLDDVGALEE